MDKKELELYLLQGLSSRQISKKVNLHNNTVMYWIHKYELQDLMKYKKPIHNDNYFKKIDTPEKAYILGFLLGDSSLNYRGMDVSLALADKEILDFIQSQTGGNVFVSTKINLKSRTFPHARMGIHNIQMVNDLHTKFGGELKINRHIPIISEKLEKYLLLGFFDAEGCITWGRRKDRNRIWQKISFTSQLRMLDGIQNILLKNGIPTKIRPKGTEQCYVLEFADRKMIFKFLDLIYDDDGSFVILKRKYNKALALRLELGEFGEAYVNNIDMVIPSEAC